MMFSSGRPFRVQGFLRAPVAALSVLVIAAAMSGCNSSSQGRPPCLPPDFSVTPSPTRVGEEVTVKAQDARCDPRYGKNARILITIKDSSGRKVLDALAPMDDAGGFTYTFRVPLETAPGEAAVVAFPFDIDWCDDTGKNRRAGQAVSASQHASCTPPTQTITIAI